MDELLSVWNLFRKNQPLGYGRTVWKDIFEHLYELRRWEVQDRLAETGLIEDWEERIDGGEESLPLEIELWFRNSPEKRKNAQKRVETLLSENGGSVVESKVIEEINYHGILGTVPAKSANIIINSSDTQLVKCQQVMFFRPTGQCKFNPPEDDKETHDIESHVAKKPKGNPIVALLDGMPLANHTLLKDRLFIDDPDDWFSEYQVNEFNHGTTMASLLVHGELDLKEQPLPSQVYVRPVMKPDPNNSQTPRAEFIPQDVLLVDLFYRAIKRIFEGEGPDQIPVAPTIKVINISLGDRYRPFNRSLSPWARLIDWASWKYKILFCISAGNQTQPIELNLSSSEFNNLSNEEKQANVIKFLSGDIRNRRILSPAEAINGITVGATHQDGSSINGLGSLVDLLCSDNMPSLISGMGLGFRRAMKPDILMPGGRQLFNTVYEANVKFKPAGTSRVPGQKVAGPGNRPGDLAYVYYTRGTSNANALATRGVAQCFYVLKEIQKKNKKEIPEDCISSLLKGMLVHGALWGETYDVFERILKNSSNSRFFKDIAGRHMGYGFPNLERVKVCTAQRATVIGYGHLKKDEAHEFTLPLPPTLSETTEWRRLVITLSWLSPLNFNHGKYRRAYLWFDPPKEELIVNRRYADWRTVRRGTIQHEVLDGNRVSVYSDGDNLVIKVSCKEDAGNLDELIPYGLLVTLEVGEGIKIPIYDEIRDRIAVPVRVSAK